MDEEFEVVATQVLKRTHAMVNKYRRLLMVEAEVGQREQMVAYMHVLHVTTCTGLTGCLSLPCSVPVRRQKW